MSNLHKSTIHSCTRLGSACLYNFTHSMNPFYWVRMETLQMDIFVPGFSLGVTHWTHACSNPQTEHPPLNCNSWTWMCFLCRCMEIYIAIFDIYTQHVNLYMLVLAVGGFTLSQGYWLYFIYLRRLVVWHSIAVKPSKYCRISCRI